MYAQAISLFVSINLLGVQVEPEIVETASAHLLDEGIVSEHLASFHDSHYSSL